MGSEYVIVDSHTHVYPTIQAAASFSRGTRRPVPHTGDLADARAMMAERGVRKIVLLPLLPARRDFDTRMAEDGAANAEEVKREIADSWTAYNLWAAGVARSEPDRFTAAVAVDPVLLGEEWARAEIERAIAAGARALKIVPAWIGQPPSDERFRPVWELADKHGLPVVSQSGITYYSEVSHPDNFEPVAAAYPRVKLILAHMGLGAEDRMIALASKYPNVFVDTSAWFEIAPDPESWLNKQRHAPPPTVDDALDLLRAIGVDRVLFGTNYAIRNVALPHEWMKSMGLTDHERSQIFSANHARVFDER
jgi:predicted TIM-barrel fold metal-dependent hydrolase